jgi:hypothetical protein
MSDDMITINGVRNVLVSEPEHGWESPQPMPDAPRWWKWDGEKWVRPEGSEE